MQRASFVHHYVTIKGIRIEILDWCGTYCHLSATIEPFTDILQRILRTLLSDLHGRSVIWVKEFMVFIVVCRLAPVLANIKHCKPKKKVYNYKLGNPYTTKEGHQPNVTGWHSHHHSPQIILPHYITRHCWLNQSRKFLKRELLSFFYHESHTVNNPYPLYEKF